MQSNGQSHSRKTFLVAVIALLIGAGIPSVWAWFVGPAEVTTRPVVNKPVASPDLQDKDIIERYSIMYYNRSDTWNANRWFGILTQQNPDDVWITQEIMTELKPDVMIETGTLNGGSAAMWATFLVQLNPEGRVISIDIQDNVTDAKELPIVKERVEYLIGSSTAPEIIEKVKERIRGKRVLILLDSDHRRDHVLKELELYSQFIEKGGYLIVQDSNINGHPVFPHFGPGPYEAIEEFLKTNTDFEIDKTRERLMHTMHPNGYLKRVRVSSQPTPASEK
jgi:cephalosporin hydroxylase